MREWLIKLRKKKGLTQQEVAEFIDKSPALYSAIEMGNRRPSPEVAKKIGKLFDFDWTAFYEEKRKYNSQLKEQQE